ncbi:MAG: Rho termination factor N-terminal domain-containing protein, partial [Planctomycetes bacterium]|nr:Rho termination factor N-terminal domain-containing protein [Planctomycetota bacterium]
MTDNPELASLTIKDLRQLAGEHNIQNRSRLGKEELINALQNVLSTRSAQPADAPAAAEASASAGGPAMAPSASAPAQPGTDASEDGDDEETEAFAPAMPMGTVEPEMITAESVAMLTRSNSGRSQAPVRTAGPEAGAPGDAPPGGDGEFPHDGEPRGDGEPRRRRRRRRGRGRGRGRDGEQLLPGQGPEQGGHGDAHGEAANDVDDGDDGEDGDEAAEPGSSIAAPADHRQPAPMPGQRPPQRPDQRPDLRQQQQPNQGRQHNGHQQGRQPQQGGRPDQRHQDQRGPDQRGGHDHRGPDPRGGHDQRQHQHQDQRGDQRPQSDGRPQQDPRGQQEARPPRPRLDGPQRPVPSVLDRLCSFSKGILELCDPSTPSWAQARLSELLAESGMVVLPAAGVPHQDFHEVVGVIATRSVPPGHIAEITAPGFALRGDRGDLFALRRARVKV